MESGAKKVAALGLFLLVGLIVPAGIIHAQNPDQRNSPDAPRSRFGNPTGIARIYQSYIFGIVKKSGKSQLVVTKTKFGGDQYFRITKGTKFIRNGKKQSRFPLKKGEMVWIDMKRNKKTGQMTAKKVVVGATMSSGPTGD